VAKRVWRRALDALMERLVTRVEKDCNRAEWMADVPNRARWTYRTRASRPTARARLPVQPGVAAGLLGLSGSGSWSPPPNALTVPSGDPLTRRSPGGRGWRCSGVQLPVDQGGAGRHVTGADHPGPVGDRGRSAGGGGVRPRRAPAVHPATVSPPVVAALFGNAAPTCCSRSGEHVDSARPVSERHDAAVNLLVAVAARQSGARGCPAGRDQAGLRHAAGLPTVGD
jgi:hypothetical protein